MGEKAKRMGAVFLIVLFGGLLFMGIVRINASENSLPVRDGVLNLIEEKLEEGNLYRTGGSWRMEETNDLMSTYTLGVVNDRRESFGIMLSDFSPAYCFWVNGRLVSANGDVSGSGEKMETRYRHEIIEMDPGSYVETHGYFKLDLVIETLETDFLGSNFDRLIFGSRETLETSENVMIGLNLFAVGSFLTLFLFSFSIYLGGREESYLLFFSLTSLVSFFKSLINAHPVLAAGTMDVSYTLLKRVDFSTGIINILLVFLLYDRLYDGLIRKGLVRSIAVYNLLGVFGILVFDYAIAAQIAKFYYFGAFMVMAALCAYLNAKAILQGRKNALILFFGLMIYIESAILAILKAAGFISEGNVNFYVNPAQYGSLIFVLIFSMVIAVTYAKRFNEAGLLSRELAHVNENLEKTIGEKTVELRTLNEKLKIQAETDGLTGLWNHNAIFHRLQYEIDRTKRYGGGLSIMMVDVDHFKKVNTAYGHLEGDRVLLGISAALGSALRSIDYLGRYGGEEFLVILPNTGLAKALETAERLRQTIDMNDFGFDDVNITISLGVAAYEENDGIMELIDRADARLYEAKRLGRNRAV